MGAPGAMSHKDGDRKNNRVVVVHCKAGKGRSGTMACSYLVSECGWTPEDALARFTERRMRPKFGAGVSIPSQLRWVSYVDRWTKSGKKYVDREVEIVELHIWGLRHGVKVSVQGFVEDGKKIRVFHAFKADERFVIESDAPGGAGMIDLFTDMAGGVLSPFEDKDEITDEADYNAIAGKSGKADADQGTTDRDGSSSSRSSSRTSRLLRSMSRSKSTNKVTSKGSKTGDEATFSSALIPQATSGKSKSLASLPQTNTFAAQDEPGGQAVIFKPKHPIRIPNSDVNVSIERRNRAHATMGLTLVTAVAHAWFNTFFEGKGPEQDGKADDSGVFDIEWDKLDGIKGSSQKGTKAADRIAVVWRAVSAEVTPRIEVQEAPAEGEAVPQMAPADWKGGNLEDPDAEKHLGLRKEDPESAEVSKASSIKSQYVDNGDHARAHEEHDDFLAGVKTSGPEGGILDNLTSSPRETEDSRTPGGTGNGDVNETGDKTAQNGFIVE